MKASRRSFVATAAGAVCSLASAQPQITTTARRYAEVTFRSARGYVDPFRVDVDVAVRSPTGARFHVPAFWAGEGTWRVRITGETPGTYTYETVCSDPANSSLHGVQGAVQVEPYSGDNILLGRGPLKVSENRRYFQHADGTPFFWLADTWWMALTKRLRWPEDFKELAADRVSKGFNVVQIVAGLYPDMAAFDPRGANEAGFPWEKDYARINPAYFDMADLRIHHLGDIGIVPCIVGCWGYYLPWLGVENMKRHWRYVIARWGALPVVWCLAGEGSMPWYLSTNKEEERKALETGWTEIARYVRKADPYQRLITIHPSGASRDVVTTPEVLDFDMLQTGHGDYRSLPNTVQHVVKAYSREPRMPVINSEVCYEGILERCREDIQRQMFWASILNGTCGHTYGANGIWQLNLPGKPYGPSPHGRAWGDTPWQEAAALPGGRQLGFAAQFLRTLPWHRMEPQPDWVRPRWSEKDYDRPYAAGIPGELRVIYTPSMWENATLTMLEPGAVYQMTIFNPSTAETLPMGQVQGGGAGEFKLPDFPNVRDWLIVLRRG